MTERQNANGESSFINSSVLSYINNYVTDEYNITQNLEAPYFTSDTTFNDTGFEWENNAPFPIFLTQATNVSIPDGIKYHLTRIPKGILRKVDKDINIAIEKCLIAASNLTSTLFLDEEDKNKGWKSLHSTVLHDQLKKGKDNTFIYKHVIEALKYSKDDTCAVIECNNESYEVRVKSKEYRFTPTYCNKKVITYELKENECINNRNKFYYKKLNDAIKNPIGNNLLCIYQNIQLPSEKEIIKQGKKFVKEKYRTKKGKLLTRLNNKPKKSYIDYKQRSFLEENIIQFKYLTSKGFLVPSIGNSKSGGRVVDSFNLMPSWIRLMCTIENEEIIELDYTALHPNIAMTLFGGKTKFLSHDIVADSLNTSKQDIKIEHLSFFNKYPNSMTKSILYKYYLENEPEMLKNLLYDKAQNGYKHTSKLLFAKEVEIMTEVIKKLNSKGIYVLYVYDALYCKKGDADFVKAIMNQTILDLGVYTNIK